MGCERCEGGESGTNWPVEDSGAMSDRILGWAYEVELTAGVQKSRGQGSTTCVGTASL